MAPEREIRPPGHVHQQPASRRYLDGPGESYLVDPRVRRNCRSHRGPESWHDVHHAWWEADLRGSRGAFRGGKEAVSTTGPPLAERAAGKRYSRGRAASARGSLGAGGPSTGAGPAPSWPRGRGAGWARVRPTPLPSVSTLREGGGSPQQSPIRGVRVSVCICICESICLSTRVCLSLCVCVFVSLCVYICVSVCVVMERHLCHNA